MNNQKPFLGRQLTLLKKNYHARLSHECDELTVSRYFPILYIIKRSSKAITQKEISEQLSIDKATLVRNIDYFIEKKLIEKVKCQSDKRINFLHLTTKGEIETQKLEVINQQLDETCKNNISADEWITFLKVSEQINQNLTESNN